MARLRNKPRHAAFSITTVEDILDALATLATDQQIDLNERSYRFVDSVKRWVGYEKALTTAQASNIIRIFERYLPVLISEGYTTSDDARHLIANPRYRLPVVPSRDIPREVRYLGQNRLGFRFKMNEDVSKFIEGRINPLLLCTDPAKYDWQSGLWIVPVTSENIELVLELIGGFHFSLNSEVEDFLVAAYASFDTECLFRLEGDRIIVETISSELIERWISGPLGGVEI